MPKPNNQRAALESTALQFLSYRPRFCIEVENRLFRKAREMDISDPATLIDQIIASLKKSKFLDDASLLERYIQSKLVEKIRGPYWIKARLARFGLSKNMVETAIRSHAPTSLQVKAIKNYLVKKSDFNQKVKLKFIRRLLARGFSASTIAEAFDSIGAEAV